MKLFYGRPKKNGFYWLRRKGEKDTIVRIYNVESGYVKFGAMLAWIGTVWDSSLVDVVREYRCQWFGPIDPKHSWNETDECG